MLDLGIAPSPEVEMLAAENRRAKLHETVSRFLAAALPGPALLEIDEAHHMDEASIDLLAHLVGQLPERRWLFGVARRLGSAGFAAPDAPGVARIELKPLAQPDALRLAELATKEHPLPLHVIEAVAQRSGGNPQFLRDLLRSVSDSGAPPRFGFRRGRGALAHRRALPGGPRAGPPRVGLRPHVPSAHARVVRRPRGRPAARRRGVGAHRDLFDDDGNGYLRFRQSLLRDTAYEGLPFKQRRRLHATVAARVAEETDDPDEVAGILSLHHFVAGEHGPARHYATIAAKRAEDVYAYVDAAGYYARALEAARSAPDVEPAAIAPLQEAIADAWHRAGEYRKASDANAEARKLVAGNRLAEARLLLKQSWIEEKLGKYPEALRWAERAREALDGQQGLEADRLMASTNAWYATVLQAQGRTAEAVEWAERAAREAEDVDDPEQMGAAYFVLGWAQGAQGKEGAEALMLKSLEAFRRSGNRVRQANALSNVGGVCYWEGRWEDAMAYYERGRDESMKVGNLVNAATSSMNIAEILTDRGEHAEAEAMLQKSAAGVEILRVPLLPGRVPLDAGPRVAAGRQDRRGARTVRRGAQDPDRSRCRGRGAGRGRARRRVPAAQGRRRRRARACRRDPRPDRVGGRDRPAEAAAPPRARLRDAAAVRPVRRARCVRPEPRCRPRARRALRDRAHAERARRTRPARRRRGPAGDGGREPVDPRGLQGARAAAGAGNRVTLRAPARRRISPGRTQKTEGGPKAAFPVAGFAGATGGAPDPGGGQFPRPKTGSCPMSAIDVGFRQPAFGRYRTVGRGSQHSAAGHHIPPLEARQRRFSCRDRRVQHQRAQACHRGLPAACGIDGAGYGVGRRRAGA
ncbi:MAG: tetratricopeptide repeat protein [Betaproteobacteria bacterium]|nr:tetratricopeptide repeat protein [Betaproteobacteria bacterium]